MNAWMLQPEIKYNRAQEAQRGVVERMTALLASDAAPEMMADDLEVMSLQFRLAAVNLMVSARELREVEEERRFLAREQSHEAMRFGREVA